MSTIQSQLTQLRLYGMAHAWQTLSETRQNQQLSLSEGMELLLQAEEDERGKNRFERLRKNASFRYPAALEQIRYDAARGLDKNLIAQLATGSYITHGQPVLITGPTGCGKSYLASALGHQACLQGYRVAYFNLQKLLTHLKLARLAGTHPKTFERLAKTQLLIIDDFGLSAWEPQHRLDMMEIMEDRHAKHATIIASQLPVASWYDLIGEPTIADAILDRIVHAAYRIDLKGESLRKKL